MRGTVPSVAVLIVLALFSLAAFAQTETGQISGNVTDPTGAVVSGAKITITSLETQAQRAATTNSAGLYTVTNLQHGNYEVKVEAQGFAAFVQHVQVTVGARVTLDVPLSVGGTATTVEVVGVNGVQVETQSQELSQVVDSTQITELPTLTRNPYDLVATAGNVGYSDSQVGRGVGLSINGQRAASTNILLDGGENVNLFDTTVGQSVPLDSVEEFRVITSDFTAEYGRASGGIVNVATKSGTRKLHGSLYEFNRVSDLAANTFDNSAKGLSKGIFARNQFGFSVGGPVPLPKGRNKLFFFESTEWTRVRGNGIQNVLVPTPQFLGAAASTTQNFFNTFGNLGTPINGPVLTKDDLVSQGVVNPIKGGPFDQLPGTTPILGQVNFAVPSDIGGGAPQNSYSTVARFDYNLSDRTTIYGRYALESANFFAGTVSFSPYQGFNTGQEAFNNNGLVSITHIFAPNLVSQTKGVFNRLNLRQPLGAASVGPTLFFQQNTATNILGTNVALPGYLPLSPGNAIPFGGPQNLAQLYQDVNYTRGKHQFPLRWPVHLHARQPHLWGI